MITTHPAGVAPRPIIVKVPTVALLTKIPLAPPTPNLIVFNAICLVASFHCADSSHARCGPVDRRPGQLGHCLRILCSARADRGVEPRRRCRGGLWGGGGVGQGGFPDRGGW